MEKLCVRFYGIGELTVKFLLMWLLVISVVAAIMTVLDKFFAKRGMWRISENALLCAAALGGSVSMLCMMLLVRHKTKHVKFMAGIPMIIILQLIFAGFIYKFITGSGLC